MTKRKQSEMARGLVLVPFLVAAWGCSESGSESTPSLSPAEFAGRAAQVTAARPRVIRKLDLAAVQRRTHALVEQGMAPRDLPRATEFDGGDLVAVEANGDAYLLKFDQTELEASADRATALGLNLPIRTSEPVSGGQVPDDDDDLPAFVPKGWSNGVDSRTPRFINATYPASQTALRKVGFVAVHQISPDGTDTFLGNGSGALVGRRLVLSVAHAVVREFDGNSYQYEFVPRMDGGTYPYGDEPVLTYFFPALYYSNNCYSNYDHWNCPQWDWSLLLLGEHPWSGVSAPGWMTLLWGSESTLQATPNIQNVGYPSCGDVEEPANCAQGRPWGSSNGAIKYFNHPGGAYNQNLIMRINNSTSEGHSGSPVFITQGSTTSILGLWNVYLCHKCASNAEIDPSLKAAYPEYRTYPNLARRIDTELFNIILNYRAAYP